MVQGGIDQRVAQIARAAVRCVGRCRIERCALDMVSIDREQVLGRDILIRASIYLVMPVSIGLNFFSLKFSVRDTLFQQLP